MACGIKGHPGSPIYWKYDGLQGKYRFLKGYDNNNYNNGLETEGVEIGEFLPFSC